MWSGLLYPRHTHLLLAAAIPFGAYAYLAVVLQQQLMTPRRRESFFWSVATELSDSLIHTGWHKRAEGFFS